MPQQYGFTTPRASQNPLATALLQAGLTGQSRTPMQGLGNLAKTLAGAYLQRQGTENQAAALSSLANQRQDVAPAQTAPVSNVPGETVPLPRAKPDLVNQGAGFDAARNVLSGGVNPQNNQLAAMLMGRGFQNQDRRALFDQQAKIAQARADAALRSKQLPLTKEQEDQRIRIANAKRSPRDKAFEALSPEEQKKVLTKPLVSVGAGGKFGEEFGKLNAKAFFERREGALDAANSLRSINSARDLLDKAYTGVGAEFQAEFGNALLRLGIDYGQGDAVANTQAFGSVMAGQVASLIKNFGAGTGLSDADRQFATRMAGGDVSMDKTAIKRIIGINEKASRNVIEAYNKEAETIPGDMSPFPLAVDVPAASRPRAVNPTTGEAVEWDGKQWVPAQ